MEQYYLLLFLVSTLGTALGLLIPLQQRPNTKQSIISLLMISFFSPVLAGLLINAIITQEFSTLLQSGSIIGMLLSLRFKLQLLPQYSINRFFYFSPPLF